MSNPLESVTEQNFEVVKEYLFTGNSKVLTPEYQRIVDICLDCYKLFKRYPQRNVCMHQLMALHGISRNTAISYINFCRNTWGDHLQLRREFLETWMIQKLVSEINNPNSREEVRAKNLATLQKYLDKLPDNTIDPKLLESNIINIQVNIGGRSAPLTLSEEELKLIPLPIRQKMLAAMNGEIDDGGAVKLLES